MFSIRPLLFAYMCHSGIYSVTILTFSYTNAKTLTEEVDMFSAAAFLRHMQGVYISISLSTGIVRSIPIEFQYDLLDIFKRLAFGRIDEYVKLNGQVQRVTVDGITYTGYPVTVYSYYPRFPWLKSIPARHAWKLQLKNSSMSDSNCIYNGDTLREAVEEFLDFSELV